MTRFLLRSFVRTLSVLLVFHAVEVRAQARATYVPRQVIIKLDASTSPAEAAALRSSLGATVKERFTSIGAELWDINSMTVGNAVDRFKSDPHVDYIEPNYIVRASALVPNDPRFGEMWGLNNTGQNGGKADADIDAPEAWPLGTGGTVIVGDIDTGMDMDHVDLVANLYTNPGEIPGNHIDDDGNGYVDDVHGWDFVNNDNNPDDDHGHGTHTAGTIAAVGNNGIGVTGVCWTARIMPLKFLNASGSGSTANAILAVQYATRMGVRLTNNSWGGGGFSQGLRDAIEDAGNHGILFVAAAGNASSNNDTFPSYPASYDLDNIIAVASTDRFDQRSSFSNYGVSSVDLGAPGSDILSTLPNNTYGLLSGTSMATPHVSGACALVWSVAPAMTGAEVKHLILTTVDPLPALAGKVASGGRLNLFNMLSSLDAVPPGRVADLAVQSTGSTTARLTWTAVGDDGQTGEATLYDIRYSKNGIYWSNFTAAPQAAGAPHPQSAGKNESFEVTGLDYNAKYYFALVVVDENSNRSSLSNLPSGSTLGAPHLEYSPASFDASLQTGGSETQHLTIRNGELGTLDFAVGSAPSWIRVVPPSGRVNAGQSVQLDVIFDATHLAGGPYASNIVVATNDATQPAVPLPVNLQVTSAADIAVAPASIDFGNVYTGQCAMDTVVVTNIGAATLFVGSVTTTSPFATPSLPFSLSPGASRALEVQFCPVSAGKAFDSLSIGSNDPDHPVLNVPLQGLAQDPPVVSVSPSSLSADLFTGAKQDQTLTVSNLGGSNLDFEISFEDTSPGALKTDVFGVSRDDKDVLATGKPLSSAELKRIKASIPPNITLGKSGEIDRGKASKSSPHPAMTLERVLSGNLEEVFGSTQNQFQGGFRSRGNLFTCTTSTVLVEHRFFMNPIAATQMWFLVYEGLTQVGSYDLVSASNVTPAGPGEGWYSSGEVDVPMEEGRYYLIITAFEQTANYYNELGMIPYPIPASFGELTAGAGWDWAPPTEFPPAPVTDVPDFAFGSSAAYYQTLVTKRGVRWLSVDPETATVPAAGSTPVKVTFDAARLFGGNYDANIHVASNDPVHPDVAIPAHLHVTGAADIAVSKALLDYGAQFIGAAVKDTLVVSNAGTDVLTVSGIVSSHPDYTVDDGNFVLAPNTSQNVVVTFAPTSTGSIPGVLTISSDDPDEPALIVNLAGQGVSPPVISVSPSSFSENLFTGGQANHTLTIANSGASNLTFKLSIEDKGGPTAFRKINPGQELPAPTSRDITPTAHPAHARGQEYANHRNGSRTQTITSPGAPTRLSAAGLKVLLIHTDTVDEIRTLLLGFGDLETVDLFNGESGTPTLAMLQNYDAVILIDNVPYVDPEAMGNVLADYVDQGGSIVMTVATFVNGWDVRGRLASGGYFPFTLGVGAGSFVTLGDFDPTHPIMNNVHTAGADLPGITTLAPGAQWVASWEDGTPFVATQGDHVVGVNAFVVDGGYWTGDIPIVLHNAVLWATGARWLDVSPREGTVPSNGHLDITVAFDAADLFGGDYAAAIHVKNNDPLHSDVAVPAALHVTGAPDIDLSTATLNYGPQFIGAAIPDTLVVSNRGTDLLVVSNISSSRPEYTVDASAFSLAPRQKRNVIVTFAPLSTGAIDGTLNITSNDADEGLVTLALHGSGVEPPGISVTPSSFSDDLLTGEKSSHTMTISNTGASPLEFQIKRVKVDVTASSAVASRALKTPGNLPALVTDNQPRGSDGNASTSPHQRVAIEPQAGMQASGPAVLVIQNYYAWGVDMRQFIQANFGITATTIGSAQLAATNLSNYDIVITCGDQDSNYYQTISSNVARFEAFVSQGGVVQYQLATQGDNVAIVGGVQVKYPQFDVTNVVTDPAHPIVQGLPTLLQGNYANHTMISNLRPGTDVITTTQTGAYPTTVEYKYGAGTVIATGMTWEWLSNNGYPAGLMLTNACAYSLWLQSVAWLKAAPSSGVVAPGQSLDVTVDVNAAGLYGGNYGADLQVLNNDPLHPNVAVPVSLHVTGAPDISVAETQLAYGQLYSGQSDTRTLHVLNTGTDVLSVTAISSDNAAYSPSVSSFSLPPQQGTTVVVTFSPPAAGSYPGSLSITSNDPDESPVVVVLSGTAVPPPVISVAPLSLDAALISGEVTSQSLTIQNSGGSVLSWSVAAQTALPPNAVTVLSGEIGSALTVAIADKKPPASIPAPKAAAAAAVATWVVVQPASGTVAAGNSAHVDANFNTIGLLGGSYYATLSFTSNDPAHPAVSVPVHLHVIGVPDISLTPNTYLFFGNVTVGQSRSEILAVSNVGTDDLIVSAISSSHSDFTPALTSFTLAPGTTRNVSIAFHPVAATTSFGMLSVMSNDPDLGVATLPLIGQGTEPPAIAVNPTSFHDHLTAGASTTHIVTIANNGAGPLQFNIRAKELSGSSALVARGATSTPPVAEGHGGSDPYGYHWRDSSDPRGPVFSWVDAQGGSTIGLRDDDFAAGIPLGFTFNYYGTDYASIGVGSNGWLSFNGSGTGYPAHVPQVDAYAGAIAPYARELAARNARYIRYLTYGTAPARKFVVEYNSVNDAGGGNAKTFEVILSETTNTIRFQYLVAPNAPVSFGIESPDQTMGLGDNGAGNLYISPAVVKSSYAIEFTALVDWLTASPLSASVPAGQSLGVTVTVDAATLSAASYTGELDIQNNDPNHPVVAVSVALDVDSTVTLSGVNPDAVPTQYGLQPNRPNPFNPITTIAYDLPQSGRVKLAIYDVNGRLVKELVSVTQPAGRYDVVWDGRDDRGGMVASGVYFYRLVAGNFVQTRKMVLLK